jgi:DNA-binding HxlR family transcriptional regulator
MAKTADYSAQVCSVAAALEVVGDPWTLLIVRDALRGARRFEQFQSSLGCARNVLAARLKALVEEGVLERRPYSERPPRSEYRLTEKGRDLYPVVVTLLAWGDKHVYGGTGPVRLTHSCGSALDPRLTCAACGEAASARDVRLEVVDAPTVADAFARREAANDAA